MALPNSSSSLPAEKDPENVTAELPPYAVPTVRTFSADELLAALGPAQAGSVGGDNVFGP